MFAGKKKFDKTKLYEKENSAESYVDNSKEKYNSGDFEGALKGYKKAIITNPNYVLAYTKTGDALIEYAYKIK